MRRYLMHLCRVLLAGALLLAVPYGGCIADTLRDVAEDIDDEDSWDEVINDIEDWFD